VGKQGLFSRALADRRLTCIPHCSILWNAASNDAVTDGKITVSPILVVVRVNDVGHLAGTSSR
jgi:hypothetical protein